MHEEGDGLAILSLIVLAIFLIAWMFVFSIFILSGWLIGLILAIISIYRIKYNRDIGETFGGWIFGLISGIVILLLGLRFLLDTNYRDAAFAFIGRLFGK
ncbi:hypothetical protein [Acetanaerobacterium elongatum]|uniref:Uncharacterized protein n=1 Tax=Acetanaerobacterium elongatum TaxID=258515 RepID=A0A1H0CE52_9FIRM|nr:hypothetical protein [Acetanaerobacterium elongatum]SDN56145.1 hypothetical protein SAMN05192585_1234 [Acetanaerobacterium elongatum]